MTVMLIYRYDGFRDDIYLFIGMRDFLWIDMVKNKNNKINK